MDPNAKLNELIDDAEELLQKLADDHGPEVEALRDRVDKAIGEARNSLAARSRQAGLQFRELANTLDDYVHDFPWLAVGTGMLVAGALVFLAATAANDRD